MHCLHTIFGTEAELAFLVMLSLDLMCSICVVELVSECTEGSMLGDELYRMKVTWGFYSLKQLSALS